MQATRPADPAETEATALRPNPPDDRTSPAPLKLVRIGIGAASAPQARLAVILVAAVVGPTAADLYGIAVPKSPYWFLIAGGWIAGSGGLHILARLMLKGLTP